MLLLLLLLLLFDPGVWIRWRDAGPSLSLSPLSFLSCSRISTAVQSAPNALFLTCPRIDTHGRHRRPCCCGAAPFVARSTCTRLFFRLYLLLLLPYMVLLTDVTSPSRASLALPFPLCSVARCRSRRLSVSFALLALFYCVPPEMDQSSAASPIHLSPAQKGG